MVFFISQRCVSRTKETQSFGNNCHDVQVRDWNLQIQILEESVLITLSPQPVQVLQ